MNYVIDIGNSFSKLGIYNNGNRVKVHGSLSDDQLIQKISQIKTGKCIIASVRENIEFIIESISEEIGLLLLDEETSLPIHNGYHTPKTLGVDRIAGVVAANMLFPDTNLLVIDVGTAITYDFINSDGRFIGGGISPGPEMKLKALNFYTDNLPKIDQVKEYGLIGKSTEECILSGVFEGTWAEITGIIAQYNHKFTELRVIMCGGGLNHFESKIKDPIFVAPELILDGLNRILEYNVSEES